MNKKAFLVGVGGIGVSSLAKYLHENGYEIYGSNNEMNENSQNLQDNFGLKFFATHHKENIEDDFDFLIYSPAIPENNPERVRAKEMGITEYSYPEFLGKISEKNFTISISGTNGKTTTTTMVAELLDHFAQDASIVMGGISKKFNSNFVSGKSDIFVVESCEFKNSFLDIFPDIIAITNITPDHLDFFRDFENYKQTFINFLSNLKESKKGKVLICDVEDRNLKEIVQAAQERGVRVMDYQKYEIKKVTIPGEYNRENAKVALAVMDILNLDLDQSRKYLAREFEGSKRRFSYIGNTESGSLVFDDYAHNPEGLHVLKEGLDEQFPDKRKVLIFQPHLFSRTQEFFESFVEELSKYDVVYLLPVYKSREKAEDFQMNSQMLFNKVKEINENVCFCKNFSDCQNWITTTKEYGKDTVIVTAGAGDIYKVGERLVSRDR